MKDFIEAALAKRAAILLILAASLIGGLISYITIPKESNPDVKIPIIYIVANHEGISPEDAERLLIRPLEQQLKTIEGVREMRSKAFEGGACIVMEFTAGFDVQQARTSAREKTDAAKPQLPRDTKDPTIHEINMSLFPVLVLNLSGDVPQRTLYRLARDLKDKIESSIPSVLKAEIVGMRDEVVEVLIDPARVQGYALSFEQVTRTFMRNNQLISAGNLDSGYGRFAVKVPGTFETITDVMAIPIANHEDAVIRLVDVAEIRRTFKDSEGFARDRGLPSVAIEISKRTGEHLIETIEAVKNVVADEKQSWPEHLKVNFIQDQSKHVHEMLNDLQNSIILALILVMAVMVIALGWRSALLVGVAVPGSFLMGVFLLSLMGYTINMIVLFSLIFSVGMLVDGAIIVVEYADRRMVEGVPASRAFIEAAKRMAWPVITSITTILVVFLPLLFWPGVVGQFMKFLPITLLLVLGSSLLMALIFVPAIGSSLNYKPPKHQSHVIQTTETGDLDTVDGWTGQYIQLLKKFLEYPGRVLIGAVVLLVIVKSAHSFLGQGVEFFPTVEPESAAIWVHGRGNMSIFEKDALVKQVEERILKMEELSSIYTRSGAQTGGDSVPEDVIGTISIEFIDWQLRRKADQIFQDIKDRTQDIAGIQVEVVKKKMGPPASKPIQLQVQTRLSQDLLPTTKKIRAVFESLRGLKGIEDDGPLPGIEWKIIIDRAQASKFGADIALVGNAIKLITNGICVGKYRPEDSHDEIDILLRYLPQHRHLDQLSELRVVTTSGNVPITNFVTVVPGPKVTQIRRADGTRVLTLRADIEPGVLAADKIKEIQKALPKLDLPEGTQTVFKGEDKDRKETGVFLLKAFGCAIFLIMIILMLQFNSFFHTMLVLSAVIMSTIGVFIGLMVHQLPFGVVMGGIGIIALAGIIVSNNIILIDTYNVMTKDLVNPTYEQLKEAIVRTCAQRLRPVILTKLTAILGLLPIMFGVNIDFLHFSITKGAPATQFWILLSLCIVYGLLFASSLTLFVTPAALLAHINRRFGKKTLTNLIPFI